MVPLVLDHITTVSEDPTRLSICRSPLASNIVLTQSAQQFQALSDAYWYAIERNRETRQALLNLLGAGPAPAFLLQSTSGWKSPNQAQFLKLILNPNFFKWTLANFYPVQFPQTPTKATFDVPAQTPAMLAADRIFFVKVFAAACRVFWGVDDQDPYLIDEGGRKKAGDSLLCLATSFCRFVEGHAKASWPDLRTFSPKPRWATHLTTNPYRHLIMGTTYALVRQ
ncbi:hypothetical protein PG996_014015 [Apiospora saccharicola]|uniref:Uncharacterized protein n=1 Tax=Apiospora saccharicola TaxID=335842 RepID=A0ABR1TJ11_9PEZI